MTELKYLDITKAGDGHIKVPSIGLISPAITESIAKTALASFSDGAEGLPVSSLIADINPVQNLNGQSAPYPAGVGKNKLPITATTSTVSGVTFTVNADGTISTSGTASAGIVFNVSTETLDGTSMVLSGCPSGGSDSGYYMTARIGGAWSSLHDTGSGLSLYGTVDRVAIVVTNGTNMNGKTFSPMVRANGTDPSYAPYSNICPITGWTGMNVVVSPTLDAQDGTTYPISWADEAGTVYGGTLDVTTGLLTVTHELVKISDLSWEQHQTNPIVFYTTVSEKAFGVSNIMSDAFSVTTNSVASMIAGTMRGTASNAVVYIAANSTDPTDFINDYGTNQLLYELATPQTYQLTPQAVLTILGQNNIWADTGDVEVAYCADTKLYIDKVLTA